MPLYDSMCNDCGEVAEYMSSVEECTNPPPCGRCGGATSKVILSAPFWFSKGRFEAFRSSVDGSIIRGERDLKEHNLRNNVVNLADGYDDATITSGNFGRKIEPPCKKQIVEDIGESIRMINDGYKPDIGVYDGSDE